MKTNNKTAYYQQAKEWLKFADYDFRVAKDNFQLSHYSYVCQLCQQTAEKYLKAFLILNGQEPKRTHILRELVAEAAKFSPQIKKLMSEAKELEQYYIPTRYPVGPFGTFGKNDAQAALQAAEKIIQTIKRYFPQAIK